jgi:prepilin-type N-terminal cleavage/methylation domain-containing protein
MRTGISSRTPRRSRRSRPGFTLIELLLAMTMVLLILGIGSQFFRKQSAQIAAQAGRLEAQQNGQFGLATMDRELRMAGAGVVDAQPILVQADTLAMSFNANLVSKSLGDVGAVYVDVDADSDAVQVWRRSEALPLPRSAKSYPDSTYMKAVGVPSDAETISYWLSKDSTAKIPNEYILFRRANNTAARMVAKSIIVNPGDSVFTYYRADSTGALTPINLGFYPLFHKAPVHGSPADTGRGSALIDSIRAVRIRFTLVHHDRKGDVLRKMETTIRVVNSGLNRQTTCGELPLGVLPSVSAANVSGVPSVTITWNKSGDEGAGEKDVERYAIYKRSVAFADFGEPFAGVPAGSASYSFVDTDVHSGDMLIYGVAALDCTPNSSNIGSTLVITVP